MSLLAKLKVLRVEAPRMSQIAITSAGSQSNVSDKIDAYNERLAICLEGGDVAVIEAHNTAAEEAGDKLDSLARRQIGDWNAKLSRLPRVDDKWMAEAAAGCSALMHSNWLLEAVRLGWSDEELFGIHYIAPRKRIEAMGLVVSVTCSSLRRPLDVTAITPSQAIILTGTDQQLIYRRFRPSLGPPIWDHPVFERANDRA